jgi:hypothetical protein
MALGEHPLGSALDARGRIGQAIRGLTPDSLEHRRRALRAAAARGSRTR